MKESTAQVLEPAIMVSVSTRRPGTQIGRFTLERLLGTGGMGEVYLATAEGPAQFAKRVVVKLLLPHVARDAAFLNAFVNEARLTALVNHPNVATVFDFGHFEESYFLCMEYVEGLDLSTLLRRSTSLEATAAARICADALRGLHAAHTLVHDGAPLPVVHRDVSTENILVSVSGISKLTDFGIARALTAASPTTAGHVKGKLGYVAPELILGADASPASDVYAMGVVLHQLLTGARPFVAQNDAALVHRIVNESVPEIHSSEVLVMSLGAVARTAMAKKPEERFPTAASMVTELERALKQHAAALATPERVAAVVENVLRLPTAGEGREGPQGQTAPRKNPAANIASTRESHSTQLTRLDPPQAEPSKALRSDVAHNKKWLLASLVMGAIVVVAGYALMRPDARNDEPPQTRVEKPTLVHQAAPTTPEPPAAQEQPEALQVPPAEPPEPSPPTLPTPSPTRAREKRRATAPASAGRVESQARFGSVVLMVNPWARVRWRNKVLGMTPFEEPLKLPVGKQVLVLTNEEMGVSRKVVIDVSEGATVTRKVNLAEP